MYTGSSMTKGEVVFDTGSGWYTISTRSCKTCFRPNYDPSNSTSSVLVSNASKVLSVIFKSFIM